MDVFYERMLRPHLFKLESEKAHEVGLRAMEWMGAFAPARWVLEKINGLDDGRYAAVSLFGLKFPNRVGLAAGFDKNGTAWPAAAALGFGHVEIGTVTALAQPGNPRPRMFRYPSEMAVINRMGFNNAGAAQMAKVLARLPGVGQRKIPLGINLGKSKITPLEKATEDYLASYRLLATYADYLVLNVSSPNTPDLRKLQDEERLRELLGAIQGERMKSTGGKATAGRRVPVLLKIAPDLSWVQIDAVLSAVDEFGLDGIIATNTTLARPGFFAGINEAGGLSGAPLRRRSTEIVRYLALRTQGRLPLIAAGGITDLESAGEKMDAGASLVQIYSGMIYRGPWFAAALARALCERDQI
ncbi:MAG: quinone-dependent dihydroorotate dehydrogenase [Opitutaceae bacterium]|nr:quinone-dependent dihydroorotate dehydrogenase [Opitutaceae bacterium]